MQLTGKHIVNAALANIWKMLMDTDILAKVVPGISRLEKSGDNTFKSILEIKDSTPDDVRFLQTVINDYIVLTR